MFSVKENIGFVAFCIFSITGAVVLLVFAAKGIGGIVDYVQWIHEGIELAHVPPAGPEIPESFECLEDEIDITTQKVKTRKYNDVPTAKVYDTTRTVHLFFGCKRIPNR